MTTTNSPIVPAFAVVSGAEGDFYLNELKPAVERATLWYGERTHVVLQELDGVKLGLFAPEAREWPIYILVFSDHWIEMDSPEAVEIATAQILREMGEDERTPSST